MDVPEPTYVKMEEDDSRASFRVFLLISKTLILVPGHQLFNLGLRWAHHLAFRASSLQNMLLVVYLFVNNVKCFQRIETLSDLFVQYLANQRNNQMSVFNQC